MTETATMRRTPSLVALEFPDVTPSTDSPDLVEFKNKVREVALRHSRSMHCGSIKTEMRALGIVEEKKVKVTVTTNHPFTFVVSVTPSALAGKTALEQAAVLAGMIGKVNLTVGGGNVSAVGLQAITITPETVVEMSREVPDLRPSAAGVILGENDAWFYASEEGRVKHLFINILRDGEGVGGVRSGYRTARCGYASYTRLEESLRGSGSFCATCTKIATGQREAWDPRRNW